MWSLYVLILSKLKLVRTLLRIAFVADTKSYDVIICFSSCEKFTKSEIYSNIAQIISIIPNLTIKDHPRSKVIQFKDHEVNWKDHIHIYDFLYVFHVKFGHNMHHSEDTAH